MVSGTTQVVAVIGHPIAQVKSPDNFNRYFAEQHMDSVMIPVDIVPDAVAAYLNALRGWQNMTGVLVTVPHKQRAAALVDDLTPRARRLNAVNVIRKLADGRLQGDMLDGVGFQLAAKRRVFSRQVSRRCSPVAAASAAPSPGDCARRGSVGWPCTIKPRPPGSACMTFWLRPFRRCN
ncbi:shikimate/quinate 5-dehydrogenase [Klebsiella pneumoniae]|uniref:Shikimate/quinate 5-dehydrogenase n=1 Tax=Klebsiella pneumoniae TaxID=573 RepID=A0A377UWU7_KLEPN|nr:shikimate/quinate 5-dehydrogenase [Klebsiella pneumoniae]